MLSDVFKRCNCLYSKRKNPDPFFFLALKKKHSHPDAKSHPEANFTAQLLTPGKEFLMKVLTVP